MKVNGATRFPSWIPAIRYYVETADEGLLSIILIDGLNDGLEQAEQLVRLIQRNLGICEPDSL
jgi:adenine C2-methylase RlmN of 23S rRNA A2503 and tRNA A37